MADETKPEQAQQAQTPAQIPIDESNASTIYTNFCRLSLTPEEVVLSFGLNTQVQVTEPIQTTHRVVMNFYTAKRLLLVLQQVANQHEGTFGVLEIDPQKRVRSFRPASPPSTMKPVS